MGARLIKTFHVLGHPTVEHVDWIQRMPWGVVDGGSR